MSNQKPPVVPPDEPSGNEPEDPPKPKDEEYADIRPAPSPDDSPQEPDEPACDESYPKLDEQFDKIFLVNCKHRPDRLKEFWEEVAEKDLVADKENISVYPAIIGDYTGHPAGWGGGNGAWGCLQSHRRIMEDLMHMRDERGDMNWDTALFLEDDVFFLPNALRDLELLMDQVPADWGQIYLGGQNRKPVTKMAQTGVVQCNSVNRTHAYAVSRQSIQKVYHHISYMADYHSHKHIDHQLELAHQRGDWKVYGPAKWICGQRAGSSNISGQKCPDLVWS